MKWKYGLDKKLQQQQQKTSEGEENIEESRNWLTKTEEGGKKRPV